ncbi:MAG: prepilin-type N-terminal cleavage/methylation domain-containing protein [Victivallaceae bacterium]|nr:prepilin-type N-terminal cleavage/methylation domain-containing protein [Victivallaceae bacterium]
MRRHKSGANALTRRNFSLIEMLAVIAIIAILAGLSFGAYNAIMKRKAKTRTEATVNAISIAIRAFKTKHGYFPQTTDNSGVTRVLAPAYCKDDPAGTAKIDGDYLIIGKDFTGFLGSEIMKNAVINVTISGKTVHVFIDGYKDPVANLDLADTKQSVFYYKCPGLVNKESFDLFSAGPDRRFGTEDDIWPQGLRKNTDPN